MERLAFTLLLALALASSNVHAKTASSSIEAMITDADSIVIGTVLGVVVPGNGFHTAVVHIDTVLKGPKAKTLLLDVTPTWTANASRTKSGERMLLFATTHTITGFNHIAYNGRGRMPIDSVDAIQYATFGPSLRIPNTVRKTVGPNPRYKYIRRANLTDLKDLINETLKGQPTSPAPTNHAECARLIRKYVMARPTEAITTDNKRRFLATSSDHNNFAERLIFLNVWLRQPRLLKVSYRLCHNEVEIIRRLYLIRPSKAFSRLDTALRHAARTDPTLNAPHPPGAWRSRTLVKTITRIAP